MKFCKELKYSILESIHRSLYSEFVHLAGTFAARSLPTNKSKAAKEPASATSSLPRQNYRETTWPHLDSFKISPKPNTDGMGNCLQQPGQLLNQLKKSMRVTTSQLIKLNVP